MNHSGPLDDLRRRAEEIAREVAMGMPENRDVLSPAETQKVLHELRVHQVELEMQNEELRNAQEELEASRARYFDLYDLAPVGYLSVSEQGLILEANLTFATMLGVARARGALLQQPLTHFILPEDEDIYYLHRKSLLETGVPQVCELRVLREDGARFWARLEATAAQEAEGAAVSRIAVSDITERKQSEELLRASEQRYRILFGSANDGIMLHDLKGQILEANGVVSEQLGYGSEELLGMNVTNIRVPEAAALYPKHMDEVRERGRAVFETSYLCRDGSAVPMEVSSRLIEDAGRELVLSISRDITKRRETESRLEQNQQQQLEVRNQFLSRMSHELRSPLAPIHQFVTILLDGLAGDLNAEQREYLVIILRNARALRTMIADLLDVTRAESGKLNIDLRYVHLAELTPQILTACNLANTKDLLVSFDVPGNLPPVLADPDRVRQIIDNLLDNAIKFTPEQGEVSVRARVSDRNPGFLCIEVADTGRGIARSERKKIFEYSYQVKNGAAPERRGLGIGLHICKELVSSHGGQIWVESQPGHGSSFFFTLPVFSLEGQLASIVRAADLITHSIALITLEVSRVEGPPLGTADQPALLDAWRALQSCVLPNLVALLPRVPHTPSRDTFFLVACVNQSNAEVLAERLRSKLAFCQSLRDSMLEPRVSFILLDTRPKKKGIPSKQPELVNEEVVDHIESLMETILHQGEGVHEWTQSPHSG